MISNNIRHKSIISFFSIITAIMLTVFSVLDPSFAAIETATAPFDVSFVKGFSFAKFDPDAFTVPFHLGEVQNKYKGNANKFVIHIQDAHLNYFAQKKIVDILGFISGEYGIETFNLEGGTGEYDLSVFTDISGGAIREEVSDYFLKKGEINAAEYFAINNPDSVNLWGIENEDLYLANLKVYRDFIPHKETVEKYLKEISDVLNKLKKNIFDQQQLKLDMNYAAYKAGNIKFKNYLLALVNEAEDKKVDFNKYKNIYLLVLAMEKEKKINFKKANIERSSLVKELKKRLSKEEIRDLLTETIGFKTQKISKKKFYEYLLKKAEEVDIAKIEYPQLILYLEYISTYDAVDRSKVMEEVDALENAVKQKLYTSDTQRELNSLSKNLELLKTIFNFSMTKNDYNYYLNNKDAFSVSKYVQFIDKTAPGFNVPVLKDDRIRVLDTYRADISSFYEYSFARDKVFLENMKFDDLADGSQGAVLLTGGFHTDNLCDLFEKENITYVSLSPKFVSKKGYENPYFTMLAGETDQLQQILRSVIARASMIQVASKLNTLGERVWGRTEIDAFQAAVVLVTMSRDRGLKIVISSEGKELVSIGEGDTILEVPDNELVEFLRKYIEQQKNITAKKLEGLNGRLGLADKEKKTYEGGSKQIASTLERIAKMPGLNENQKETILSVFRDRKYNAVDIVSADFNDNAELEARSNQEKTDILSFLDNDRIVIVVKDKVNGSGVNLLNSFLNSDTALQNMIRHELIKTLLDIDEETLRRLEAQENDEDNVTILEEIKIDHMTDEELDTVLLSPEPETDNRFYKAVQIEQIARADREVLWASKPGEYFNIVIVPLLKEQLEWDGSSYAAIDKETERKMRSDYGINTKIIYYPLDVSETEIGGYIKNKVDEKVAGMSEFADYDKARIVAFSSEEKAEFLRTQLSEYEKQNKLTGVVKGEFLPERASERLDIVSLISLGLGLNEWHRLYTAGQSTETISGRIKKLLLILGNYSTKDEVMTEDDIDLLIEGLLNGLILMKIKKIDYNQIREYMKNQAAVLESV